MHVITSVVNVDITTWNHILVSYITNIGILIYYTPISYNGMHRGTMICQCDHGGEREIERTKAFESHSCFLSSSFSKTSVILHHLFIIRMFLPLHDEVIKVAELLPHGE